MDLKLSMAIAGLAGGVLLQAAERVSLGEPVLVAESPPQEKRWGFYQFPKLERFDDGRIEATFSVHPDAAESYGLKAEIPNRAISEDGGKSWRMDMRSAGLSGIRLPNGDRLKP